MCGLTGFWPLAAKSDFDTIQDCVRKMGAKLTHRGPDDAGAWVDAQTGLALAHQRLSIVDLSPAGHQPMVSASGRWVLVFNGEIYNYAHLRKALESKENTPQWRGHSDTETLLAGFETWGIEATLQQCVGMFALALWDRERRQLTLARDRLGEKPLYYGRQDQYFLFGSELKALAAHPAFKAEVDRSALAGLMRHGYIPAPYSIYTGIKKLPPGHYLCLRQAADGGLRGEPVPYWTLADSIAAGMAKPLRLSDPEAVTALEEVLTQSVAGQMQADVPLGAFLSGGIDSSLIVALMQKFGNQPARTFSIGFDQAEYNEAKQAAAVASHLGAQHTELYVTAADTLAVVPRLPTIYCEPFADSSQIPTFLVSQMTRQQVTVALTGDGADELFGGYNYYQFAPRIWAWLRRLPQPARQVLAPMLRYHRLPDRLNKLGAVVNAGDPMEFYQQMGCRWRPIGKLVKGVEMFDQWPSWEGVVSARDDFEHWMMATDARQYLLDDVLVKVDRAAMANSLETRVPFLDHRVVEFAWRLPLAQKIREGKNKWIVRQLLYRYVPAALVDRPKKGFSVPLAAWLRGPLREWAEDLLDERRLQQQGYLYPQPIRQAWTRHLKGTGDYANALWPVLMFQSWLAERS